MHPLRLAGTAVWLVLLFVTPHTKVVVRLDPMRFRFSGTTRTFWIGGIEAIYARLRGFGGSVAAGVLRSPDGNDAWTGRARASVHPSSGTALGIEAGRAPYLWTTASLGTPVLPTALRAFATMAGRGFDAEAAVEQNLFHDSNAVTSAYGWLLVPIARGSGAALKAGYAFTVEDAAHSRFALANPDQLVPPGSPAFDPSGRYDPYYTPEERRTHAALGALTVQGTGGARFHLSASYSLRTTELAPELAVIGNEVTLMFVPGQSHPWEARAVIDLPLGPGLQLSINGGIGRKLFYDWRNGVVSLVYRLRPWPGSGRHGGR